MLQRLIVTHGGVNVNHMWGGQTTVTHIVATTLTNRKSEMLQDYRVVTPDWILACVEQGKLLDWIQYRTFPGKDPAQRVLALAPVAPKKPLDAATSRHTPLDLKEEKQNQNQDELTAAATVKETTADTEGDFFDKDEHNSTSVPPITDPAFITHFYQNSRLHHLSHWKAELRRQYFPPASVVAQLLEASPPSSAVAASDRPPILFHVDYDSFFVSASLLSRPELRDRPVVVSSGSAQSSDVASANYVARRQFGVRNGMWLASARQRCPTLVVLPLEFAVYERKSAALYNVLSSLGADLVYPVSVDEAVVDVSSVIYAQAEEQDVSLEKAVAALAATVRNKVREAAGIEVSVGAGTNMLLARLALARAKPAGQCFLPELVVAPTDEDDPDAAGDGTASIADDTLTLRDLPGVGRSIVQRLSAMGITSLRQLRAPRALAQLTNEFGPNHGLRLHELGRGIDRTRLVDCCARDRKSVGVEISWGVRARSRADVDAFLKNLLDEVCRRLNDEGKSSGSSEKAPEHALNDSRSSAESACRLGPAAATAARGVTLKVYRALPNADVTRAKRLGHGQCDIYSRSRTLGAATCDPTVLLRVLRTLMDGMDCPPARLRGVGIQLTKLERVASAVAAAGSVGAISGRSSMLRFVTNAAAVKKAANLTAATAGNVAATINAGTAAAKADSVDTTDADASVVASTGANGVVIKNSSETAPKSLGNYDKGCDDNDDDDDDCLFPQVPDAVKIDWDVYSMLPASLKRVVRVEYNLPDATASQLLREDAEVEAEAAGNGSAGIDLGARPEVWHDCDQPAKLPEEEEEEAALLREEAELEIQAEQIEIERQIHEQRLQLQSHQTAQQNQQQQQNQKQQQQKLNQKDKRRMPAPPAPLAKRARLTRRPRMYQNTLTQQFPVGLNDGNGSTDVNGNHSTNEAGYNYFRHPSILDADVLRELPAAVLAELQRDLKLRGVASISTTTATNMINKINPGLHASSSNNANSSSSSGRRMRTQLLPPPPARDPPLLDTRHAPADASALAAQWLTFAAEAGGGPHDADVRVVTDYACRLAANPRYWRDAVGFFRAIERELRLQACGAWHPFVASLKDAIQATFESQGVPVAL